VKRVNRTARAIQFFHVFSRKDKNHFTQVRATFCVGQWFRGRAFRGPGSVLRQVDDLKMDLDEICGILPDAADMRNRTHMLHYGTILRPSRATIAAKDETSDKEEFSVQRTERAAIKYCYYSCKSQRCNRGRSEIASRICCWQFVLGSCTHSLRCDEGV
jgi:hypothetical protein